MTPPAMPTLPLDDFLSHALENGLRTIGEAAILTPCPATGKHYALCHRDDAASTETLAQHQGPEAARTIALQDDNGEYRPLRSAPNLRHGWLLTLDSIPDLRLALDFLYPAALGMWRAHRNGTLAPLDFRAKLARQTGMYRSANRISNTRARKLLRTLCDPATGCLKKILWQIDPDTPVAGLPPEKFTLPETWSECPLLCQEACNIAVSEARKEARNEVIIVHEDTPSSHA